MTPARRSACHWRSCVPLPFERPIEDLDEKIQEMPLGVNREEAIWAAERAALQATPTIELKGLLR